MDGAERCSYRYIRNMDLKNSLSSGLVVPVLDVLGEYASYVDREGGTGGGCAGEVTQSLVL